MKQTTIIIKKLGLITVVFLALLSCAREDYLVLTPDAWDFGTTQASGSIEQKVTVENTHRDEIEVVFTPTSPRLRVDPGVLELEKHETARVTLQYEPPTREGNAVMQVIIGVRTGQGKVVHRKFFPVTGKVHTAESYTKQKEKKPQLFFEYFYDPGCKGCEIFLVREMFKLQQELDIRLLVSQIDIQVPDNYETYMRVLEALGENERAYPAVVFRGTVLQGEQEIEQEFEKMLRKHLEK